METFQNLRVLSLLTDTSVLSSGEKARRPTPWVCPLQMPMSLPVLVSHSRIAFSVSSGPDGAAKTVLSCESTTAQGASVFSSKFALRRRVFESQTTNERSSNVTKTSPFPEKNDLSAAILMGTADGSFRFHHVSEFGSVETTSDKPSGETLSDRKGIFPVFKSQDSFDRKFQTRAAPGIGCTKTSKSALTRLPKPAK